MKNQLLKNILDDRHSGLDKRRGIELSLVSPISPLSRSPPLLMNSGHGLGLNDSNSRLYTDEHMPASLKRVAKA